MQAVSLFLPTWPTDRVRRRLAPESARAILLTTRDGQREIVAARCAVAAGAGVRIGMTSAHARALLPIEDVYVAAHDASGDERALTRLAVWATRLAPRVAPDPPDGLLMDVSGCERLYGGVERLIHVLHASVTRLGLNCRITLAPTFAAAWALARYNGRDRIIAPPEDLAKALAPLPLAALRIDHKTVSALGEVGVERIEHLRALARDTLPARFGEDVLLRLDQAMGQAMETITPVRPMPPLRIERLFDGPTDRLESIELATRELIGALCGDLHRRESGLRRLVVTLFRADLPPAKVQARLSRPSRDERHLWSLIEPKLERLHLGFGVEGVRVGAGGITSMPHQQHEHWVKSRAVEVNSAEFGRLLDVMAARLGDDRLHRLELRESHVPERAVALASAPQRESVASRDANVTWASRPSRLFDPPRPIDVTLLSPDGPLMSFRRAGDAQRVRLSIGPERLSGEWWRDESPAERDYYRVLTDDGRWRWVFRARPAGRWFLHGEWA